MNEMVQQQQKQQKQPQSVEKLKRHYREFVVMLDRVTDRIAPPDEDDIGTPASIARAPITFGVIMLVVVFGLFGLWSAFAPLSSAAIAVGTVVLDSNRKTIQHLEGGIVEKILVYEGKMVEAGDPLVRLNA